MTETRENIVVAQIGCGYWGPNVLRNFSAQQDCWVKFVAEINPERQAYVRAELSALRSRHFSRLHPE